MRAVQLSGYGGVEVMRVAAGVAIPKIVSPKGVVVKVNATAVNRGDTMQRKGFYPPPPGASDILGLEAAGVVAEVGAGVSKWKVGDRVMGLLSGGGYAEYVPVHEGHLMPIPEQMSFVEAAAVSEVFLTAWQCLRFNMDVQKGDHVLIHAAASGVGTAASQLVERVIGGVAVGTASEGKLEECRKYASHCVSRTVDPESKTQFASKVRAAVGDRINAVIDPVFGGGYLQESVSVCAVDGTITVLAMMGGNTIESYQCSEMFKKRITLRFSTLRGRTDEYKAGLVSSFVEHALPQFTAKDKALVPVISKVLPLEEVREAHRMVGANETIGKVVLTL